VRALTTGRPNGRGPSPLPFRLSRRDNVKGPFATTIDYEGSPGAAGDRGFRGGTPISRDDKLPRRGVFWQRGAASKNERIHSRNRTEWVK